MIMKHLISAALAICLVLPASATVAEDQSAAVLAAKPRLVVLTDIGNEPDDQMSLVRLMVYANELDIEGLVATTSTWQRAKVSPEIIRSVLSGYGEVLPNLRLHAQGWPDLATMSARVSSGVAGYGMAALEKAPLSDGAKALIAAADRPDPRPLWVPVWGGANTLAQALAHVRASRSPEELARFVAKLRVYSISDQDDAGPWIRREFPGLFYIVKPSPPDSAEYGTATWTGIAGDVFYRNGKGADFTTVTNEWLDTHIRSKGPLGKRYPEYLYIMEGDTPSFLGLIPNGLQTGEHPNWGGWGGRYILRTPYGETRPIWTQGGDPAPRVDSRDAIDGYVSDQATIWRWRSAFQHDFAARMDWTIKPYRAANHPPVVRVNGTGGSEPLRMEASVGQTVHLDASATTDPDGNGLTYRWFHYAEAGFGDKPLGAVTIAEPEAARTSVTPTAPCRPPWRGEARCSEGVAHLILAVTDDGSPALTRYRRIILTIRKEAGSTPASAHAPMPH
jgi:hypothetical protein